ncbi:MAG: cation diffusion facilitator family transporter [candidate division WOR-3 bacterium]
MDKIDERLGFIEGWVSIVVNILLFALKLWVGVAMKSIAMTADAWHTLSDTFTSFVVILGFWISGKPADEEHPFGHGRAEIIAAIIIGVLLGVVGINFLVESGKRFVHHISIPTFKIFAVIIFGISMVLKEALSRFAFWVGRRIKAESVIADGWHHRSDAIASGLILIGVFLGKYLWWIDSVLGIGVSFLILYAGYDIVRIASNKILGEAPDEEVKEKIHRIISKNAPAVMNIHHIHIHRYGNHTELTVHIRLPGNMNVFDSHSITKEIENKLREELRCEATLHVEPFERLEKEK